MMTPEREKEIRESLKDHEDYWAYGGKYAVELLAELDRVREENERWRDTVRDQDNELDMTIEALDWITKWGDIHDVHGQKAHEALAKIRGEK